MNLLKDSSRKWVIVAMMFLAIICNYLDLCLDCKRLPALLRHHVPHIGDSGG